MSKVWSFCNTLRDDGVGYGDYLEQLTYLIFLKMADEYAKPPYKRDVGIPAKYTWSNSKLKKGAELEGHYVELLRELGTRKDMHSCASAAKLRGGGPILFPGMKAKGGDRDPATSNRHRHPLALGSDGPKLSEYCLLKPAGDDAGSAQ